MKQASGDHAREKMQWSSGKAWALSGRLVSRRNCELQAHGGQHLVDRDHLWIALPGQGLIEVGPSKVGLFRDGSNAALLSLCDVAQSLLEEFHVAAFQEFRQINSRVFRVP